MTRNEAYAQNLRVYDTGRPCAKGHTSPRYTASGACIRCAKDSQRQYSTKRMLEESGMKMVNVVIDRRAEAALKEFVEGANRAYLIQDGVKLVGDPTRTSEHQTRRRPVMPEPQTYVVNGQTFIVAPP